LFDEPTAALDEASERLVLKALQELRDLGKMVILVAHDSRFIPFADRVYTVKNGSIEQASESAKDEGPISIFA
jgi:ABC-type lipoprotein export system ATPase subunit